MTAWIAAHFSYPLLFVWSLFEGEIGLMLGGYFASEGHLKFAYVVAIAFCGALISDTVLYVLGKHYRLSALKRIVGDMRKLYRLKRWFRRYGGWVIVFDRFIYGTHVPAMLLVGMTRYAFWKFLLLEIIGAAMWALSFSALGFYFGRSIITLVTAVQHNTLLVLVALAAFFLLRRSA